MFKVVLFGVPDKRISYFNSSSQLLHVGLIQPWLLFT